MALFGALFLALLAGAQAELPGCKIRITSKALELGKSGGGPGRLWVEWHRQGVQELRVSLLLQ